ncbi:MAG: hydrogenase 4 subunit F [Acidobacteria bacterium]|nr:hydrogenase 4 subunit F [Acidobacteriota bacterium]
MNPSLSLLLLPPLIAGIVALVVRPYRRFVAWVSVVCAAVSFAASVALAVAVVQAGTPDDPVAVSTLWRVDALSALLAVCIAFVALLASALGPGLGGADEEDPARMRQFRIFTNAFASTMLVAVTIQNVALMWVAIEATTITSAMVIPLTRTKASVEASWKYLLICSVGIALAFAGTVLAYFDFVATAGEVPGALNWTVLRETARVLHPQLLQTAFAFVLIGYGTKAGLAPMHTWLPDAHSEAPSPVSAMMSGVLLAVAMYAIARWKAVVDAAVDPWFTNSLLLGFGLLSVTIGAFSLVIQRHYKRMLAYSSVEHMGLVAVGLALGPLGTFAALLHVVNHAVAKSMSFLLAGRILHRYDTTEIGGVTGLLRVMPWTGSLFAVGILALVGLPPFGLFVSEFLLIRAAIVTSRFWVAGVVLVLLLTVFVSLIAHLNRMLYGEMPSGVAIGETRSWPLVALALSVGVLIVLGVTLPQPISTLIAQSVRGVIR